MGENYVLGSREDENQYKPYKVHPKMFEELPVLQVGTGTQHVVVLTSDSQEHQNFPRFTDEVLNFRLPPSAPKVPKEKIAPKKQLDNQEDHQMQEEEEEKKGHEHEKEEEKLEVEVISDGSKKRKRSDFEKEENNEP